MPIARFKVVLLGEGRVGKTSILLRYVKGERERFHALGPIYYRDADGALLVYDITDFESFQKLRAVPEAEALDYAASVGATHVYTSAKLNKGLEDAFAELSERMATRRNETRGPGAAGLPGAKRSSISIVDDPVAPKKKDSCC
ncbi:GTPase [Aureococcus anophagefferens]|nr:GTPase [Aureococcus anophagefferens]